MHDRYERVTHLPRIWHVVYALVYNAESSVVYVGKTNDENVRKKAHLHYNFQKGKSCRVTVALSQPRYQPREEHFSFRILWKGHCTDQEAVGIEQHYMEKFDTMTGFRPPNDSDLCCCIVPYKLNVARSCTNRKIVEWAGEFVELTGKQTACEDHVQQTVACNNTKRKACTESTDIDIKRQCMSTKDTLQKLEDTNKWALELNMTGVAYETGLEIKRLRLSQWKMLLSRLNEKYEWATSKNKEQLAKHIENLIAEM
jgi:hypothetical protein